MAIKEKVNGLIDTNQKDETQSLQQYLFSHKPSNSIKQQTQQKLTLPELLRTKQNMLKHWHHKICNETVHALLLNCSIDKYRYQITIYCSLFKHPSEHLHMSAHTNSCRLHEHLALAQAPLHAHLIVSFSWSGAASIS